jgi:hypothetical protein
MSDYKGEWEAAKTKFENSTGVKKPAPTKKNLFGKAVRQKVGIAAGCRAVSPVLSVAGESGRPKRSPTGHSEERVRHS